MGKFNHIPEVWIPGSKSHSIRCLLIAAFAKGISHIENILFSSDTIAVMHALLRLGVLLSFDKDRNSLTVDSRNLCKGIDKATLDMKNSGTGTYLMMGFAASLGIPVTITGDESLCSRPIGPLENAYRELGAEIEDSNGFPPFTIKGPLKGGRVSIECRTSQYLSSLLFAAALAEGDTYIDCPILFEKPYVGMSLKYLDDQNIEYEITEDLEHAHVKGNQRYTPSSMTVGGDYSSACFFFALSTLHGKKLKILGLDPEDTQGDRRVLEILEKMGCHITWLDNGLIIKGPKEIEGGVFDLNDIPDSLPILSVVATQARGKVILENVANARIKETDRIRAMRTELEKLGAHIKENPDGLEIEPSKLHGADVKGYEDHRIIMALSILGTVLDEKVNLDNTEKVDVTFPGFFDILEDVLEEFEN